MIIIACECLIDQGFSLSKPLKNVQEFIPEFVPKTLLVPVMGKDSFSNKEFFFSENINPRQTLLHGFLINCP